jgi:zinc/manganese transport system substrate-binding protein
MGSRTVRASARGACLLLLLSAALPASAALRIVATMPDVADMTRAIGGDRVAVEMLAEGTQDPHRVPVKPSFVTKLNRADAVVVQGLGLEHGFLPPLLEVARNPAIAPGQPAYIDASLYVEPLEVPSSLNRDQGELHPLGNPHFNLDPVNGKKMARAIAEGLERVDPEGTDAYRAGLARFEALLDGKIAAWQQLAAPLRGRKVISNHMDLPYLAARYGFEVVGTIEYKPGVPATPGHLEELVTLAQHEHVDLVVHEISYEDGLSRSVAQKIGAPMATVSVTTGGLPDTSSYVAFVEANLQAMVDALAAAKPPPG